MYSTKHSCYVQINVKQLMQVTFALEGTIGRNILLAFSMLRNWLDTSPSLNYSYGGVGTITNSGYMLSDNIHNHTD